MIVIEHRWE